MRGHRAFSQYPVKVQPMIVPSISPTPADVATHYDDLDRWYRELWGEHVHHGLWHNGVRSVEEATRALIDYLAMRLNIQAGDVVCDIGCGYGGTCRVLARDYGAEVVGVTVSRAQWEYACRATRGHDNPRYMLGDFLVCGLDGAAFDAVFSIESSEHMADKRAFFWQAKRILRPGGRFGVYAWLACDAPGAWAVRHLLEPICREGRLPGMGTAGEYTDMMLNAGFIDIECEDVSDAVERTWHVIARRFARRLLWDRRAWQFLLRGPDTREFAKSVFRILAAYETHTMRYALITARKPGA